MEIAVKIILSICKEFEVDLKSDSDGKISIVAGEEELCINNFSEDYQVKILKEYQPDGVDYKIIEQV